jgi:hypothetical protein
VLQTGRSRIPGIVLGVKGGLPALKAHSLSAMCQLIGKELWNFNASCRDRFSF